MHTQRFQKTREAVASFLNSARSLRQERTFQKGVAEHAVHRCELGLRYYADESDEEGRAQGLIKLQRCQLELDEATRRLARADQDFSVVRGLIQWAGYPPFPIEAKVISMTIRVVPVGVYNLFAVEAATYHDELVPRIVSYKSCCRLSVFP